MSSKAKAMVFIAEQGFVNVLFNSPDLDEVEDHIGYLGADKENQKAYIHPKEQNAPTKR